MSHEGIEFFYFSERLKNRPYSIEDRQNAVSELKPHLTNLLGQLREHIEAGKYDSIVQEGSSATLPAYILGRAIGDIYKMKGFRYPTYITLNGKKEVCDTAEYDEMNEKALKKITRANPSSALVITDSIVTGGSMRNALRFLSSRGISPDVASILLNPSVTEESLSGTRVFSAKDYHGYRDNLIVYASPTYTARGRGPQRGSIQTDPVTKTNMAHVWPDAQKLRQELVRNYFQA